MTCDPSILTDPVIIAGVRVLVLAAAALMTALAIGVVIILFHLIADRGA